jgi:hypothetical protein
MNSEKERRKYKRFHFREDIPIEGTRMWTSTDISEGGIYISAILPYAENSVCDVPIPFNGQKLTVKAHVRYCQPGIGMGVMFTDLGDEQREIIRKLIESIAKESTYTEGITDTIYTFY